MVGGIDMKNKVVLSFTIFLLVFILSSCKNDDTIKIGFSNNLTGANSELGISAMYGAMYAVDEINASGGINGRQLELIVKDDFGDPDKGVEVDNELIAEGCVAIIGHGTSRMAEKTVKNANDNNFILISATMSTNVIEGIDDNFFRVIPSNSAQAVELAKFIHSHTPGETLVFAESGNTAFTTDLANTFLDYYSSIYALQTIDEFISFQSTVEDDYDNAISIINETTADNVLIIGSSYDVAKIYQKTTNEDIKLYLPVWSTTHDIFSLGGNNINNSHGMNYFNTLNPEIIEFSNLFQLKYGDEASFSSMFTYEAMHILAKAIDNADSLTTNSIKTALLNLGGYRPLNDEIMFNEFGDIERKTYNYHLINHDFEEVN
jgi:branched-chain amino acid transport system substrate-binding protein